MLDSLRVKQQFDQLVQQLWAQTSQAVGIALTTLTHENERPVNFCGRRLTYVDILAYHYENRQLGGHHPFGQFKAVIWRLRVNQSWRTTMVFNQAEKQTTQTS